MAQREDFELQAAERESAEKRIEVQKLLRIVQCNPTCNPLSDCSALGSAHLPGTAQAASESVSTERG